MDKMRCPNCGSTAIDSMYADDAVRASLVLICEDCDFQFSEGDALPAVMPTRPVEDDPDFEGYPARGY